MSTASHGELSDAAPDSLSDLFRRVAYAQLPSRFHALAQLGFPLAYQLWTWGWHRTAGWLVTVALFSLWALAEQHLTGQADSEVYSRPVDARGLKRWRFVRGLIGATGSLLALTLFLEAFARVLAFVFKCPGCAG